MIEVYENYVKECVRVDRVDVLWMSTKEQWVDILTKVLCNETHSSMRNKILNRV